MTTDHNSVKALDLQMQRELRNQSFNVERTLKKVTMERWFKSLNLHRYL